MQVILVYIPFNLNIIHSLIRPTWTLIFWFLHSLISRSFDTFQTIGNIKDIEDLNLLKFQVQVNFLNFQVQLFHSHQLTILIFTLFCLNLSTHDSNICFIFFKFGIVLKKLHMLNKEHKATLYTLIFLF